MAIKTMTLTIHKKWFDMIKSGEKQEEYREINGYYDARFNSLFYDEYGVLKPAYIIFRNGYKKDSPKIKCLCELSQGCGNPKWGAIPDKFYFILEILKVEEISGEPNG